MIDDEEISSSSSESDCGVSFIRHEYNFTGSSSELDRSIYLLNSEIKGPSRFEAESGQFQFYDNQPIEDLPKFPPEKCYWRYLAQKTNADKYSDDFVSGVLDKKLEKIASYFKRLRMNQLTKKELAKMNPTHFLGPYYPTPLEIERLNLLQVQINWSVPKIHMSFSRIAKRPFSMKEFDYLIKRWKKFQKVYKIYDLRPILGVRCGLYDEMGFKFFRMIDPLTFLSFIQWMGKGLPNHSALTIRNKLTCMADWFHEGQFKLKKNKPISGLEYKCIEAIYDRYGYNCGSIMELLIGKRYKSKYTLLLTTFAAIKHIPINHGTWTKQEDLEIVKYVAKSQGAKDLNELLTCKPKRLSMFELFNVMKSRTPEKLLKRWHTLKHILSAADFLKNKSADDEKELVWSHEDWVNLICKVYETKAESITEVDWSEIAKFFPGFEDITVKGKFYFLLKTRVPLQNHKNFDESLEYLYHNVSPVFKLKQVRQSKIRQDLKYAINLHTSIEESVILDKYFEEEEIEDHEEDQRILSDLRNENPFLKESNSSQNINNVLEFASNKPEENFSNRNAKYVRKVWSLHWKKIIYWVLRILKEQMGSTQEKEKTTNFPKLVNSGSTCSCVLTLSDAPKLYL